MVASLLAGSIGVFTSSITKKTIASIILSLIILGIFLFGTAVVFGLIVGIISFINGGASSFQYKMFIGPLVLLGNPAVMIGNSVIQEFTGYAIRDLADENKSNLMGYVYFVTQHWTVFSVIVHLLFTRMFIAMATHSINPLKGKTPKQVRPVNTGKEVKPVGENA